MKIFFLGAYKHPGGPNEVNRNLLAAIRNEVFYILSANKYLVRLEVLFKILSSRLIICSGLFFKNYELLLMRICHKKIIYIMHGCALKETGVNVKSEDEIIKYSDLILCVSNIYKEQIASQLFPKEAYKMQVLHNAINWNEYTNLPNSSINQNRIILMGGGRLLKRNLQICQAVNELNIEFGTNYFVDVYGYYRENDDSRLISQVPNVTFHNVIPHNELLLELTKSRLFVQNSEFESFGLGVIDALSCGCDILISKYVGAIEIISGLVESDIINNPFDVQEIKNKLILVLGEGNNKRLFSSIDKQATSGIRLGKDLISYANQILRK